MVGNFVKWYRDLEEEHLRILEEPAVAATIAPGIRRCLANQLAKLSSIERKQLRDFSMKYRGRTFYIALAKWILAFTLIGLALDLVHPVNHGVLGAIVIANVVGIALLWCCVAAMFNYRTMLDRWGRGLLVIAIAAMTGAGAAVGAGLLMAGKPLDEVLLESLRMGLQAGGVALTFFIIPMALISMLRNRQFILLSTQLEAEAQRDRLARELSESRLRLLRAQIEPHFLFNTLGAVQQLAQQGAPRAAELTANLIAFLRGSLAEMRTDEVRLRGEFGVIEAYLNVMKARMGERLRFSLSLPDTLAEVNIPSMILLTLVENAIKHGIEPALHGGAIDVSVHQSGERICIRVQDSGVGLGPQPGAGTGVGIDNVRNRLQLAYGGKARLSVTDVDEGGVLAEIEIPIPATART